MSSSNSKPQIILWTYIILELLVFAWVCDLIGALMAILLIFLSSMLGSLILRTKVAQSMAKAQQKMQEGTQPAKDVLEAFAVGFGAFLMMIPGFITSALGLLLIIPGCRFVLGKLFMNQHWYRPKKSYWEKQNSDNEGRTIDADFNRDDNDTKR